MKTHLQKALTIIFLFSCALTFAQEFEWLRPSVTPGNNNLLGADIDDQGTVYTLGNYNTSITYDTASLTASSGYYFAKHNSAGNILALKNISPSLNKIKADHSGNLYISSQFNAVSAPFIGADTLKDSVSTTYLLVAKLNSNLKPVWKIYYKNISNSPIGTMDMFTDASNNVYLLLSGNNILNIGGVAYSTVGTNGVLKVNSSGKVVYFKVLPFTCINMFGAADAKGNAYITGLATATSKTLTVDAITATNTNSAFNGSSYYDPFLVKLDASGVAQLVKLTNNAMTSPINSLIGPNGVSLDSKGNIYVYGDFNAQVIFGVDTLKGVASDQYSTNPFVVKYTNSGTQKWAYTVVKNTKPGPQFLQMRVSNNDQLYFYTSKASGAYLRTMHFQKLTSITGSSDRYVMCFDSNMVNNKWYRYISGGETNNQMANIGLSLTGDLYLASGAQSAMKIGWIDTVASPGFGVFKQIKNLAATGQQNFSYVTKYTADTLTTTIKMLAIEMQNIKVYPNPASNMVFLENTSANNVLVEIYSINGGLLKSINSESTITQISVDDLAQGLYFIKVSGKNFIETRKLLVN